MKEKRYEYEILIGRKVAWRGLSPKDIVHRMRKKFPTAKIGIRWKSKGDVLIAQIHF